MNTYKKNWTVGMRRPHQKLLQICNLLLVVVDFILLVCFVSQPYVAMSSPISMPVIGGPQVIPTSMSGPTLGPTPFGGPQGNPHVSFGSVFDASLGQGGNDDNDGHGGTIGSRTVHTQP